MTAADEHTRKEKVAVYHRQSTTRKMAPYLTYLNITSLPRLARRVKRGRQHFPSKLKQSEIIHQDIVLLAHDFDADLQVAADSTFYHIGSASNPRHQQERKTLYPQIV